LPSRFGATVSAAAIFVLCYQAWVTSGLGGPGVTQLVTHVSVAAASLATALACGLAASRSTAGARRGWAMLSAAGACWFLASGASWSHQKGTGQSLPLPSAADLGSVPGLLWVLGIVLPLLALQAFVAPALRDPARTRTILDGLLIAAALLFSGWALVLGALHSSGRTSELVFPLVDIVLASLVLATVMRVRRGSRLPWTLLLTGLALLGAGHVAFTYLSAGQGNFDALATSSWIAGAVTLALAALAPNTDLMEISGDAQPTGLLPALVPYVPLGLAAIVALVDQVDLGADAFLLVDGVAILVLLLARQILAHLENEALTAQLDDMVTERTQQLATQERHFRSLVRNASDVLTVVDADNVIRFQSASVERVLGFAPGELVGRRIEDLLHPAERVDTLARLRSSPPSPALPAVIEGRLRHRDGRWCLAETTVSNLLGDDSVRGILLTSRDVADRRRLEHELRHQALHDPLTGLANRTLLRDRLEHAVARCKRGPESLALVTVDLDDFKMVNDTLGHPAGDRVLVEVARRLLQSVRAGDTVARMGGDEFAILLEHADAATLDLVARRVQSWPRSPIQFDGSAVPIQGSMGVATTSGSSFDTEELLRNADLAMYAAKSKGKGGYEVFRASMHADVLERERREAALHRGLREGELVLHYQPVVDVASGRISGAEALVRWEHPDRGLMLPGEFLPLAEQSELVALIGRFALGEACRQACRWQQRFPYLARFAVSVNVGPTRQLTSTRLVAEVRQALVESGLEPNTLVLEIAENALMGDVSTIIPALHALKALGVQLALDDFGEAWSSLGGLRSLPVDKLKIDRSLVREIRSSNQEASIVAAVVAMARSLGVSTVAEGVESFEQLACLQENGCNEAQGFLLSVPLPPAEFEALLTDTNGLLDVVGLARSARENLAEAAAP
jgi:diguanylate cyclase (GGDEF)-like protein/PAS domain S-box-containing protein